MMAGYWPTPDAMKNDQIVAGVMSTAPKIVFSKTLKPGKDGPVWKNVMVLREIKRDGIAKMKEERDGDFVILGSGTIVQQFANLGLIDEYQLMVYPVILGAGKYLSKMFKR
jgi:dihydrofolate reductase